MCSQYSCPLTFWPHAVNRKIPVKIFSYLLPFLLICMNVLFSTSCLKKTFEINEIFCAPYNLSGIKPDQPSVHYVHIEVCYLYAMQKCSFMYHYTPWSIKQWQFIDNNRISDHFQQFVYCLTVNKFPLYPSRKCVIPSLSFWLCGDALVSINVVYVGPG